MKNARTLALPNLNAFMHTVEPGKRKRVKNKVFSREKGASRKRQKEPSRKLES